MLFEFLTGLWSSLARFKHGVLATPVQILAVPFLLCDAGFEHCPLIKIYKLRVLFLIMTNITEGTFLTDAEVRQEVLGLLRKRGSECLGQMAAELVVDEKRIAETLANLIEGGRVAPRNCKIRDPNVKLKVEETRYGTNNSLFGKRNPKILYCDTLNMLRTYSSIGPY